MAKFRPAGSKRPKTTVAKSDPQGLFACGFLILLGLGIIFWLLYLMLGSAPGK